MRSISSSLSAIFLAVALLLAPIGSGCKRDGGRPDRGGRRALSRSEDGGATWSPLAFDDALIEPICQASLIAIPGPGSPPAVVLVFSNPASTTARRALTVRVSRDGGRTWPDHILVDPGPAAYSCLAPLPGGRVGLLYERGKSAHIRFTTIPIAPTEGDQTPGREP